MVSKSGRQTRNNLSNKSFFLIILYRMVKKFNLQHYLNHLKNPNKQKLQEITDGDLTRYFGKRDFKNALTKRPKHDFSLVPPKHAPYGIFKRSKRLSVIGVKQKIFVFLNLLVSL